MRTAAGQAKATGRTTQGPPATVAAPGAAAVTAVISRPGPEPTAVAGSRENGSRSGVAELMVGAGGWWLDKWVTYVDGFGGQWR